MTEISLYMENLDEFVNDENKIVTYKWLSCTLQIHVNLAKRLLYMFTQQQRNDKDNELSITYFVAGLQTDENGNKKHVCCVVPETELATLKSSLKPVTSCHIYSVHKVKLKDTNALYTTDYEKIKEDIFKSCSYSAIKYDKAQARSKEELIKLGLSSNKDVPQPASSTIKKEPTPSNNNNNNNMTSIKKKTEVKGGIASMFSKQPKSESSNTTNNSHSDKTKPTQEKNNNKKEGMKAFFKTCDKTSPPAVKEEKKSPVKKESPVKQKSPVKTKIPEDKKTTSKRQGKKKADSDLEDNRKNKSKRRRIKADLFDSSSEEEMNISDEEEDPIPPPKDPSPVPSPQPPSSVKKDSPIKSSTVSTNGEKRRKRVKKLVAKTYKDEDGFMITEKVYETDSTDASDKEEPVPSKTVKTMTTTDNSTKQPAQKKKSTAASKKSSPVKGKQTALTSFFTKK